MNDDLITDLRQPKEVLCCLPSAPRLHITGYIPEAWIENEIEWLRRVGNHVAALTALNIEAMLKRWREQQESEGERERMDAKRAIEVMTTEMKCILRSDTCNHDCKSCLLVLPDDLLLNAYCVAIHALTRMLKEEGEG